MYVNVRHVSVTVFVTVCLCVCCCAGSDATVKTSNASNFRMGDDCSTYETEAKGQFAAPSGGGRQPLSRPDRGGISFGSHKAEFTTSSGDAFEGGIAASGGDGAGRPVETGATSTATGQAGEGIAVFVCGGVYRAFGLPVDSCAALV